MDGMKKEHAETALFSFNKEGRRDSNGSACMVEGSSGLSDLSAQLCRQQR
jgi:hypothetical protein